MDDKIPDKKLRLEEQLKEEEKKYQDSIQQKKDYNTLRAIRDTIASLKYELKQLANDPSSSRST
jgi:hypothetical protein